MKQASASAPHANRRPCPLCGRRSAERLAEMDYAMFDGCELERPILMLACPACGLVYNEVRDKGSLGRYYAAQAGYEEANLGNGSGGLGELDRRRYERAFQVISPLSGEARIIDLGCAKGGFLFFLREKGFANLTGVDLSRPCLDYLAAHNLGAVLGGAENIPLPEASVELVYASNLFEHLYDMAAAAREVNRVLAEGGLFYLEVPESKDYAGCCLKMWQWLMPEHINSLSQGHLEELLKISGFEILASGGSELYFTENRVQPLSFVLGRKVGSEAVRAPLYRSMKENILARLAEDARRLAAVRRLVDKLTAEGRGLFLWGLSWAFYFYYAQIDWSRAHIKALVDRRPALRSRRFGGREIRGLEALAEAGPKDAVLAFASAGAAGMAAYLKEINFSGRFFDLGALDGELS